MGRQCSGIISARRGPPFIKTLGVLKGAESMFCSQCGTELSDADRFCFKCGSAMSAVPASIHAPQASTFIQGASTPLSFGTPVTRWWLPFKGKATFSSGYEWLEQRNTLLVCRNHLVLVQGDEKRSAALDVIQAMGLAGTLVGAVRGIKDTFLNKKLEISTELAECLFVEQLLVWCEKSEAVIWRYHEKPWMFIKSSSEQLYCKFNSTTGVLHACAVLWCTAQYRGQAACDMDGIGCQFVDVAHDLPEKRVPEAMEASRMTLPD
jgi:hypothetical protein